VAQDGHNLVLVTALCACNLLAAAALVAQLGPLLGVEKRVEEHDALVFEQSDKICIASKLSAQMARRTALTCGSTALTLSPREDASAGNPA
jgi:hypothetical protein